MQCLTDQTSDAASKLKRCTLPSGRASGQMGQHRADKDQWSCRRSNAFI